MDYLVRKLKKRPVAGVFFVRELQMLMALQGL
jgi:hypothetical protein